MVKAMFLIVSYTGHIAFFTSHFISDLTVHKTLKKILCDDVIQGEGCLEKVTSDDIGGEGVKKSQKSDDAICEQPLKILAMLELKM